MAKYKYSGPDGVSLGRFGNLKKGDVIDLTPKEEAYILENGHDHLKPDDGREKKVEEKGRPNLAFPENFDSLPKDEQEKIFKELEKDEARRVEELAKENERTQALELTEMTKAELEDVVAALRAEGKTVEVKPGANKAVLMNAIRLARGEPLREGEE